MSDYISNLKTENIIKDKFVKIQSNFNSKINNRSKSNIEPILD